MSTLWTPGGEHRVSPSTPSGPSAPIGDVGQGRGTEPAGPGGEDLTEAEMAAIRDQLLNTPIEALVANHAVGLYELAAFHLSLEPPRLSEASLSLDGLAGLLDCLAGRLGPYEAELRGRLTQLRLFFVRLSQAGREGQPAGTP